MSPLVLVVAYDIHVGKLSGSEYEPGDDSESGFWESTGAI